MCTSECVADILNGVIQMSRCNGYDCETVIVRWEEVEEGVATGAASDGLHAGRDADIALALRSPLRNSRRSPPLFGGASRRKTSSRKFERAKAFLDEEFAKDNG